MRLFRIGRLAAFTVLGLFALIVLGLSAHFISYMNDLGLSFTYLNFALAVSILTLVIAGPMIAIDFLRKGAVTSMIVVEVGWVSLLNILWLASAAHTTSFGLLSDCSIVSRRFRGICRENQALQAFSWLSWLLLLAYEVALIAFTIIAFTRGNRQIFTAPVSDTNFLHNYKADQSGVHPQHTGMSLYPQGTPAPMYSGLPPQSTTPMGYPNQQPGGFPQQGGQPGIYAPTPQTPQATFVSPQPTGTPPVGQYAPGTPGQGYASPPPAQPGYPHHPNVAQV